LSTLPGAYPRFKVGGTNHGEREERGAEGAEAEGVECEEEVFPSPPGDGCGEVAMPPPQKCFWITELKIANFGAFWELILLQ